MKLNLALAQISTKLGDVESNLEKHLGLHPAGKIRKGGSTGLPRTVADRIRPAGPGRLGRRTNRQRTTPSSSICSKPAAIWTWSIGFVDEDSRHRFFIASAYLSGGKVLHVHHKVYLPTYGLFDEGRFFAWGDSVRAFDTRFGRVGMLICEDFWHASPPYLLWLDGADIMLFSSASPGRGLNDQRRNSNPPAGWSASARPMPACSHPLWHTANRVGYRRRA
ncbi:MAG: carbon-nitrogen hydrolase [Candidatus Moduliflexus flocculans]|nr:carbon-nitrogen hydrolase [Candidatus Moduliflexus flocculans]